MSSRRKVILLTILTLIILLMGVGTYSFFTADLSGNPDNENIVQTIGTLRIEYIEGQVLNAEGIRPGWSGTKTFTVKNSGTIAVEYDIVFENLINTFKNNEIVFNGSCSSHPNSCDSISKSPIPETEYFIKQNINIEPNEQHNYVLNFEFIETGTNQDYNLYAELSGKISVYETNTYTLQKNIIVDIVDNMIPITWNEDKWVKTETSNLNNEWYDYDNQKWANSVLVTTESRDTYKTANQGAAIIEEDILAYYTYIPRYRYLLWNTNNNENCLNDNCNEQEIQIKFEKKDNPKSNGSNNGEWLTHPAFTFGDSELNGIWVGKFTTSVDPTTSCYSSPSEANCNNKSHNPRVKPNMDMWRYADVSTMFSVSKRIETEPIYGLTSYDNVDSHMMKNMEWGAVAYLSHSKYGKYGNNEFLGDDKQLYINNYVGFNTPYRTETGCSSGTTNAWNISICTYRYPLQTLVATGASATGNIYGIYDMSGGVYEYVMGNMVEEGTSLGTFHANSESGTWDYIPDQKYYDSYAYDNNELSHERGILGDATKETLTTYGSWNSGWYQDYSYLPHHFIPYNTYTPWVRRGGSANRGPQSGAFTFYGADGSMYHGDGFRLVLALD